MESLRVLIADDHRMFADAVRMLLSTDARIEVVGSAANGLEAVEMAEELHPDVILMDLEMPVMDGVEATHIISERSTAAVIVLTGSSSMADIDNAFCAGASGYLPKDIDPSMLLDHVLAFGSPTYTNTYA